MEFVLVVSVALSLLIFAAIYGYLKKLEAAARTDCIPTQLMTTHKAKEKAKKTSVTDSAKAHNFS